MSKRPKKSAKAAKSSAIQRKDTQLMFDKREHEKLEAFMSKLMRRKLLQEKEFREEANRFLQSTISEPSDIVLQIDTPLEAAQAKMYDAFGARSKKDKVRLAKEALGLSEDCADAYVVLAEVTDEALTDSIELYQKGVEAGKRALGEEFFQNNIGEFWSILESRPYMRALFGLALDLWTKNREERAIEMMYELLRLDKMDHQGVRHVLGPVLIAAGRYQEARSFLQPMKDERLSVVKFSWALVLYLIEGDSPAANEALDKALEFNLHVADMMLIAEEIVESDIEVEAFCPGSVDEAVYYVSNWLGAWLVDSVNPNPYCWLVQRARLHFDKQEPQKEPSDPVLYEEWYGYPDARRSNAEFVEYKFWAKPNQRSQ